ncbi:methylated-DNA--[protein]-cysteine S-methyltransferase [Kordiimonas lacus]|uniref:methylated-DNA--[protein]-cysteine S-methyltransferase n=1 Tax=Kordiimonas lacus TaxID=637679 RepID=A0A1G6ZT89_9PROT|nr:methylated-DNA--[protein]-cysteine S-methyltransferase [Kordiimonas lacus]SDE05750.1 methylated-DNA-[protein]-cysteine S-methyltransferase [Kordiimonas lacus]
MLTTATLPSPLGPITLVLRGETIVICEFADRAARVVRQLETFFPGETPTEGTAPSTIANAFEAYFKGNRDALNGLETDPLGTPYERRVWDALRDIPAGNTTSYGAMAQDLQSSPRAIGRANGRNPVALIHPCHRVIGADGSLTGYAGGLERKEWLLKHEGALLAL